MADSQDKAVNSHVEYINFHQSYQKDAREHATELLFHTARPEQ